jgi:hypothetical protein
LKVTVNKPVFLLMEVKEKLVTLPAAPLFGSGKTARDDQSLVAAVIPPDGDPPSKVMSMIARPPLFSIVTIDSLTAIVQLFSLTRLGRCAVSSRPVRADAISVFGVDMFWPAGGSSLAAG